MISVQIANTRCFVLGNPLRGETALDESPSTMVLGVVHRDHHRERVAMGPGTASAGEVGRVAFDGEHVGVTC